MRSILVLAAAATVAVLVGRAFGPDIARYLRMRRM